MIAPSSFVFIILYKRMKTLFFGLPPIFFIYKKKISRAPRLLLCNKWGLLRFGKELSFPF